MDIVARIMAALDRADAYITQHAQEVHELRTQLDALTASHETLLQQIADRLEKAAPAPAEPQPVAQPAIPLTAAEEQRLLALREMTNRTRDEDAEMSALVARGQPSA